MTHEELIAKQQIEIEEYKKFVSEADRRFHNISNLIICIGLMRRRLEMECIVITAFVITIFVACHFAAKSTELALD